MGNKISPKIIGIGLLVIVLGIWGCTRPYAPRYCEFCPISQNSPVSSITKYYSPRHTGNAFDWGSASFDKVHAVTIEEDWDFIFTDAQPIRMYLNLPNNPLLFSDTFYALDFPQTRTIKFSSAGNLGGEGWTLKEFNRTQGGVSNAFQKFNRRQSYWFYGQSRQDWRIISVGLRAVIQSFQYGPGVKVLKLEKVLEYVE